MEGIGESLAFISFPHKVRFEYSLLRNLGPFVCTGFQFCFIAFALVHLMEIRTNVPLTVVPSYFLVAADTVEGSILITQSLFLFAKNLAHLT